jgi:hypothetical protein
MMNMTNQAMTAAGPNVQLRGMLWTQGESDATSLAGFFVALAYASNFVTFMSTTRSELTQWHPSVSAVANP